MRILSLISVAAIIVYILFYSSSLKNLIIESKKLLKNSYPLIIIIPFLLFSFIDNSEITVDRVGFQLNDYIKVLMDLPILILDVMTIPTGVLIILFLIFSFFYKKKTLILISFTFILITIYSKVLPENPKYILEIFFPFLLTFTFILIDNLKNNLQKKIFVFLLICILPFNVFILTNFSNYCISSENPFKEDHTYNVNFGCKIIDAHPFSLKQPYNFLKNYENFTFENLYVPGVYYGLLPSMINGIKVKELAQHKKINQFQNKLNIEYGVEWVSADARLINKDERIKFVILADLKNFLSLYDKLTKSGWEEIYKYKDIFYKTNIAILKKKPYKDN